MDKEKFQKVMRLIRSSFYSLERAEVLTSLLEEKFMTKKTVYITLKILYSNIKSAEKLIVKIQDEVK